MEHIKSNSLVPIITHIMYQYPENLASFMIGSNRYNREIELLPDTYWIPVYFTPGSALFSEPKAESAHGPLFSQQLKFNVPGDRIDTYAMLESLDTKPVILKLTFSDGTEKIMGEPNAPALFDEEFLSNSKATGSTHAFKCLATHRAYIYETDDLPGTGGPPGTPPPDQPPPD